MADDSDVPPLEDMTDVLQKFTLENVGNRQAGKTSTAKDRAKVKKNTTARVVQPEEETAVKKIPEPLKNFESQAPPAKGDAQNSDTHNLSSYSDKTSKATSGGMFGGMKKGFLFGPSTKTANTLKSPAEKQTETSQKEVTKSGPKTVADKELETKKDEEIPYICPKTGKTESGLTLDEVQQAMSETKGLLENQDWINDDLLTRLEKNEFLLKRFADPHFMKALQEFQTNPQAAMEKYKTNKEVERFLMEFCALLGDHFTKFGDSSPSPGNGNTGQKPVPSTTPSSVKKSEVLKPSPKIVELPKDSIKDIKKSPTIVEITEKDAGPRPIVPEPTPAPDILRLDLGDSSGAPKPTPAPDILRLDLGDSPGVHREIPEITPIDDKQIKELLKDPKVMEILLDPEIMNLVQTLKTDPDKAHSIVEKADTALRDKIAFLVSKRILDFQVQ